MYKNQSQYVEGIQYFFLILVKYHNKNNDDDYVNTNEEDNSFYIKNEDNVKDIETMLNEL